MKHRGLFIVFEGLDRVGKTTQVNLLKNNLKDIFKAILSSNMYNNNANVNLQHFPDRTLESGKKIDMYLKNNTNLDKDTVHNLFADNRKEKTLEIKQNLLKGDSYICDRYAFSGYAYSLANGINKDIALNSDKGLLRPDIVIQLDMDIDTIKERSKFGDERYEIEEIQRKVQINYKEFHNKIYWKVIDANRSFETVQEDIINLIKELLNNYIFYLKDKKNKHDSQNKLLFNINGYPYDINSDLFNCDSV